MTWVIAGGYVAGGCLVAGAVAAWLGAVLIARAFEDLGWQT